MLFTLVMARVGMAIFALLADTWSGPTLKGRILPGPIKNRVGIGYFFKKKPKAGTGWDLQWIISLITIYMWKGKSLVKSSIYNTNYFTMKIVNFSCFWIRGEGLAGAGCKTM